jgi:hypothetical protein
MSDLNLEPVAEELMSAAAVNGATRDEIHALSIAISLKRIADALWGTDDTSGLLQLLNPLDVRNSY